MATLGAPGVSSCGHHRAVLMQIVFDETRLIIYSPLWSGVIIDILFVGWALRQQLAINIRGAWKYLPVILVQRIWNRAPGVGTMLIVCTVLVAFAMYAVVTGYMEHAPVVQYRSVVAPPHVRTACPGDSDTTSVLCRMDSGGDASGVE